jgi:hypothetical protein
MSPQTHTEYCPQMRAFDRRPGALKISGAMVLVLILGLLTVVRGMPSFRLSTLLLLVASTSFVLVKGRGERDLMHPIRIFGAMWCFCLALASMQLLSIISDWNYLMWSCVLTALASFIGGFWMANRSSYRQTVGLQPECGEAVTPKSFLPDKRTLIAAAICLAVGMAVLGYEYSLIGEIPILSNNPDVARVKLFGVAGQGDPEFNRLYIKLLHPFVEFIKYGIFLAVIILCQKKPKSRKVVVLGLLIIVVGLVAFASQAGRVFIVTIAITSAVLFHYLRRRIRLVELGAAVLALFLFIGLFGSIRVKSSESAPLFQRALQVSSLPEGELWDGVAFGYGTLTTSFEIFYRLTADLQTAQRPSTGFLFYGLHRFIPRANIQEFDSDLYTGEMITPTFLGEFYADYGYWGVLFGPLILGLGYGWAYLRGAGENALYWIYVRALLLYMLISFPYVNLFSQQLTWIFDLFFMYLLIRKLDPEKVHPVLPLAPTNDPGYLPT